MANALTIPQKFTFVLNGNTRIAWVPTQTGVVPTGNDYSYKTQTINTTDTTVDIGSVSSIGWVAMQNQDPSNFVIVGDDGTHYQYRLNAGDPPVIACFNGTAIHAKADTAACACIFAILSQ